MRATRWVLLLTVGLCCLSTASMASDARVEGLAVSEGYLEDYVNLSLFPTVAARYANLVVVSIGTEGGGDRTVGVLGSGDNSNYGVFAIFLNENADEKAELDLTWAKQFNSGTTFGVNVNWSKSKTESGGSKITPIGGGSPDDFNTLALGGGVKIDMNDGKSMLELAAQLAWLSWETTDVTKDNGNVSYRVAGRMFSELSSRSTLVPLVSYTKIDLTADPDTPVGGTEETVTSTTLNLGVALHYEVNGNDLLILGVSGDYVSVEDQRDLPPDLPVDASNWSLPTLFAALEFDVYSWLTVRAGANKTFDRLDDNLSGGSALTSEFGFGLGMGLHFDHFDVDASVDPDAVFTGGYLFSGSASEPLTRVTATYYF